MFHFAKGSSSKYRAIILIQTKINYFVHVSSLLLKKVETKNEKHKIGNKVQLNIGGGKYKFLWFINATLYPGSPIP